MCNPSRARAAAVILCISYKEQAASSLPPSAATGSGDARVGEGGRGDGARAGHHRPPRKARHAAAVGAQQRRHLIPHLLLVHLGGKVGGWGRPALDRLKRRLNHACVLAGSSCMQAALQAEQARPGQALPQGSRGARLPPTWLGVAGSPCVLSSAPPNQQRSPGAAPSGGASGSTSAGNRAVDSECKLVGSSSGSSTAAAVQAWRATLHPCAQRPAKQAWLRRHHTPVCSSLLAQSTMPALLMPRMLRGFRLAMMTTGRFCRERKVGWVAFGGRTTITVARWGVGWGWAVQLDASRKAGDQWRSQPRRPLLPLQPEHRLHDSGTHSRPRRLLGAARMHAA